MRASGRRERTRSVSSSSRKTWPLNSRVQHRPQQSQEKPTSRMISMNSSSGNRRRFSRSASRAAISSSNVNVIGSLPHRARHECRDRCLSVGRGGGYALRPAAQPSRQTQNPPSSGCGRSPRSSVTPPTSPRSSGRSGENARRKTSKIFVGYANLILPRVHHPSSEGERVWGTGNRRRWSLSAAL